MMLKIVAGVVIISVLFMANSYAEIKDADLAGRWYSHSKEALKSELSSYLDNASAKSLTGKIIALISPHAGFVYSGPVVAYGYKSIEGQHIDTVVVVGFSHRRNYDGFAVLDAEGFRTPFGTVNIDTTLTKALINSGPKFYDYPVAFSGENSIEMQVPFLQLALKDFKIVLIAMGDQSYENCEILGNVLYDLLKERDDYLLVASTDMSHYLKYEDANKLDAATVSLIEKFQAESLYAENIKNGGSLMCGSGAVIATMIASKKLGADKIEILKYANSGDTTGDKSKVVGYVSAAIVKSTKNNPQSVQKEKGEREMLNAEQKNSMLKLARDSITHFLKAGKRLEVSENDPILMKEMGAFVTLSKHGQLRGCIGNLIGRGPFYLTIRDMAVESATGDPRFPGVTADEMEEIDIEISALSPLEKIDDPGLIEMGRHGVLVKRGFTSGVYLPQVAMQFGLDKEKFMNSLCGHKAGMAYDAWKKGQCEIYIFEAEVFAEKEVDS
ncbi:MAG: AmmeMemoRadiSam system protein B [Candidatus Omnitrophota bacterium]